MAQKEKVEPVTTADTAPKFTIGRLRENCLTLFGVTSSTFDGATYGLDGTYTVDETKKAINKWQNTPTKSGKKEEVN